ncbi:hypothetical protein ACG94X_08405 [Acinetobacter sp. ULE_I010]|uniref:hypothetical protein n=1 Tax=Acinetobacter sp. ULE_I010 TaxID=3373065 RepID=UPI003AF7B6B4
MKMVKSLCLVTAILTAPTIYAQTDTQNQPYGDNPNIFKVLAHKTGSAIQNTAEKVGTATEKGIQKIKPQFDETIENTKNYTTEQATIARDNTRQGIDTAVKKVEQTKDSVLGRTTSNVPIQQGSLSQSSTPPKSTMNNTNVATATITVPEAPIVMQAQQQPQNTILEEPEIKKQSLPIENTENKPMISDDDVGVPR